jgi:predicted transcriptional regulator
MERREAGREAHNVNATTMKTAGDIMTAPVFAVRDGWSIRELASYFIAKSISGAPVVDGRGRLAGVVSQSDVVEQVTRGGRLVRDIMTPTFFTLPDSTPLSEVARTMVAGRIHRLLVTSKGRIVGIVTTLDLLEALAPKTPGRRTKPAVAAKRLSRLAHALRVQKPRRQA